MTTKTDDSVLAKLRKSKRPKKTIMFSTFGETNIEKQFDEAKKRLGLRPRFFWTDKQGNAQSRDLNEKETLELARLDLRTACKRLQEVGASYRYMDDWKIPNDPVRRKIFIEELKKAFREIERAGRALK